LLTECRKIIFEEPPQPGTTSTSSHHTDSAKENDFFSFEEDEEDTSSSAENQVADYIRSSAQNFNSLCGFSLIEKISLRYNAATPSSAPVERLFSLGKLVFSPKRNTWASLSSLQRGTDCQTKDLKSFSSYVTTTGLVVR